MKILLIGDASNYHQSLAQGLRSLGHEAVVASSGSRWMQTSRDINLSRKSGVLGGALLYSKLQYLMLHQLRGFDIVQISNPVFLELKPHRVKAVFDRLRRLNGKVCLTLLGTDTPYVDMCLGGRSPLKYSEWMVDGIPTPYMDANLHKANLWLNPPLSTHCQYIYEHIDGAIAALYEYYLAAVGFLPLEKLEYAGIPVEIPPQQDFDMALGRPLRFAWCCHKGRDDEKGADRLLQVVQRVVDANPGKAELVKLQNLKYDDFLKELGKADVVVDQLYSYTPATTALLAMAMGKAVVSGGEQDYYDFIGETELRPIINPDPANLDALNNRLQELVDAPIKAISLGMQSREFAIRHNSQQVVAQRFIDFWEGL